MNVRKGALLFCIAFAMGRGSQSAADQAAEFSVPLTDAQIHTLKEDILCPVASEAHPPFLRSDISYGLLGVDCFGDFATPTPRLVPERDFARRPAAQVVTTCQDDNPDAHALGMRPDIAYGLTREDCFGDEPFPDQP